MQEGNENSKRISFRGSAFVKNTGRKRLTPYALDITQSS